MGCESSDYTVTEAFVRFVLIDQSINKLFNKEMD